MMPRAHPDLYIVGRESPAQGGDGDHRAVRDVSLREWPAIPDNGLADAGPNPIRADERGGGNAPTAIRNREHPPLLGNKARNPVTGLNYAPCFSLNSVQELSLYVGPECDPIRMPEALREGLPKILSKDVSRRFAVPEANCVRRKGDPRHAILDAKFVKGAKGIGPELQSRTNLTDLRGAFVDLYVKTPLGKRQCGA
jgi:hypothetical protein